MWRLRLPVNCATLWRPSLVERALEHSLVSPSYVFAVLQLTSNGLWLTHAQVHNHYNHQLWPICKIWLKMCKNVATAVQKLFWEHTYFCLCTHYRCIWYYTCIGTITRAYIRMHYASLRWPRITSSKWRSGPPVDAMEETGVPTGTG